MSILGSPCFRKVPYSIGPSNLKSKPCSPMPGVATLEDGDGILVDRVATKSFVYHCAGTPHKASLVAPSSIFLSCENEAGLL